MSVKESMKIAEKTFQILTKYKSKLPKLLFPPILNIEFLILLGLNMICM